MQQNRNILKAERSTKRRGNFNPPCLQALAVVARVTFLARQEQDTKKQPPLTKQYEGASSGKKLPDYPPSAPGTVLKVWGETTVAERRTARRMEELCPGVVIIVIRLRKCL